MAVNKLALTKASKAIAKFFTAKEEQIKRPLSVPNAFSSGLAGNGTSGKYRRLYTHSFTGEKNPGELGPLKDYELAYNVLRMRSWQSLLESELAVIAIGRLLTWVIGKGLKLQSEPFKKVLESEGILDFDSSSFTEMIEPRFSVWSESERSDNSRMKNYNSLQEIIYKNSIVGGDVLVVLRYVNDCLTVQVIDGENVESPGYGSEYYPQVLANKNKIAYGVELSPSGEHVAYYVKRDGAPNEYDRISVRGKKSGMKMAFLVYGSEYRIDNVRGMPLIAVMLETLKKLERYKEATVKSAEEVAKVTMFIEHMLGSTGENVWMRQMAVGIGETNTGDLPQTIEGQQLADKFIATNQGQAYNLPIGSTMKTLQKQAELYFRDFYTINFDLFCASVQIPPNIAMQKYDSNFSASRAALKDWENTLIVLRTKFNRQCSQYVYNLFLFIELLIKMKVKAPGYIQAIKSDNYMVIGAYTAARFVGANVPHIDPMKEVQAERLKLGTTGSALPLTTLEAATEALNGGDSDSNMIQYSEELSESKKLNIEVPLPTPIKAPIKVPKKVKE